MSLDLNRKVTLLKFLHPPSPFHEPYHSPVDIYIYPAPTSPSQNVRVQILWTGCLLPLNHSSSTEMPPSIPLTCPLPHSAL